MEKQFPFSKTEALAARPHRPTSGDAVQLRSSIDFMAAYGPAGTVGNMCVSEGGGGRAAKQARQHKKGGGVGSAGLKAKEVRKRRQWQCGNHDATRDDNISRV
jgi:hypothetical protein